MRALAFVLLTTFTAAVLGCGSHPRDAGDAKLIAAAQSQIAKDYATIHGSNADIMDNHPYLVWSGKELWNPVPCELMPAATLQHGRCVSDIITWTGSHPVDIHCRVLTVGGMMTLRCSSRPLPAASPVAKNPASAYMEGPTVAQSEEAIHNAALLYQFKMRAKNPTPEAH